MKKYIKGIAFAILTLIYFTVIQAFVILIYVATTKSNPYKLLKTAKNAVIYNHATVTISGIAIAFDILAVLVAAIIIQGKTKSGFIKIIKPKRFEKKKLAVVIPLAIATLFLGSLISAFTNALFFKDTGVQKMFSHMGNHPLSIIGVVIIAPICEEIIFRGVLFNYLRKRINIPFAIVVSSIAFGIAHGNGWQGIYAAMLGVVLCLMYMYTDSIFGDIIVHMTANGFSLLIVPLIVGGLGHLDSAREGLGIVSIYIILGIALILFAKNMYNKFSGKEYNFVSTKILAGIFAVSMLALIFVPHHMFNTKVHKDKVITQQTNHKVIKK